MKKFLFDLFPVLMFFITLKIAEKTAMAGAWLAGIFETLGLAITVKPDLVPVMLATVVVIIASVIQITWVKLKHDKVDKMLLISATLIILLGGMTLYLQNDNFIKWKPTVLYWLFTIVLIVTDLFWHKNLVKTMMGHAMELPELVWKKLNYSWAIFFIFLGFLNLYVAFSYSIDVWASFKLFGVTGIMFVFIILQTLILSKYLPKEKGKESK